MSQQQWDEIFPTREEFKKKYGTIVKWHIQGSEYEEVEYVDKDDGKFKRVRFQKKKDGAAKVF